MIPRAIKDKTMPQQKLKLLRSGPWLFLKPARKATVIGSKDREQGPKLVNKPLKKTIISVKALGDSNPLAMSCSPLRAKSDIARFRKEMRRKDFLFKLKRDGD